jgi:hypothetical protein
MNLRGVPPPGTDQPAARPPPFPATPYEALKVLIVDQQIQNITSLILYLVNRSYTAVSMAMRVS